MNAHEACAVYLAVKLHFKDEKYNFNAGSGRIHIKEESFLKRKDKYMFQKLVRKYSDEELLPFLVSNFIKNEEYWTGNLISKECENNYIEWKRVTESMSYFFEEELNKICPDRTKFNDLFKVVNGEHPLLFVKYLHGEVSLETLVILNNIFGFVTIWDKKISDDIIYPKSSKRIRKYGSFLSVDVEKYREITKKFLGLV